MTGRFRRPLLALALLAGAARAPAADTLVLRDGRLFDGVRLTRGADGVTLHFEHGDVVVAWDKVQDCLIQGDDGYQPQSDDERQKLADGFVRYEGKWVKPAQREKAIAKLIESQKAAVLEMKQARLWRNRKIEETENFVFEYTVPQPVFESYRDLMETYFREFAKTWKIKRPKEVPKLNVKFYVDYDAFLQVTGMPNGVLGYFRFVEPYELAIFYDRLDPRGTEEVIYHETGHYLQKLIDVGFKMPHWPGEALSEYYSGSVWNPEKKSLATGLVMEGRLSYIQLEIKEGHWFGLQQMLLGCQDRNFEDYSWGWSFVHFLLESPEYRPSFLKFFKALAEDQKVERYGEQYGPTARLQTITGEEMLATFKRYMKLRKDEELEALQKEWYDYVQSELAVTTARGLEDAAWRAQTVGRHFRARRLYEEAIATGQESALAHHRLAEVLRQLEEKGEARKAWAKAVEKDPLVPEFYIGWGTSLLDDEATKEEGRRLLHLAQDIEPDNFYLERNMARLLKK